MTTNSLYHIKGTLIDYHHDASGSLQRVTVIATYMDLATAKKRAVEALPKLGFDIGLFESIHIRDDNTGVWLFGDGVFINAKAQSGEVITIDIETTPDTLGLSQLGNSDRTLYYVLQRTIHYDQDRSGARQTFSIEGVFINRQDAVEAAKQILLDDSISVSEYEEYDVWTEQQDWPFGEHVIVHAVGGTGQNFEISVLQNGQCSPA